MKMLSVQDTQMLSQCIHDLKSLRNLETFRSEARSILLKSLFPHACPQINIPQPQFDRDIISIDLTFASPSQDLSDRDRLLLDLIHPHLLLTYRDLRTRTQWEQEQIQFEQVIQLIQEQPCDRDIKPLDEENRSSFLDLKFLELSSKQTEIMQWLMKGTDAQKIAKEMKLHIGTVHKHIHSIYKKLGVNSHTGAMAYVLKRLGYV
jgi:DNA-binding CsgD family transcriptional regulator